MVTKAISEVSDVANQVAKTPVKKRITHILSHQKWHVQVES